MKLWFLPFVREGIMPAAAAGARTQVPIAMHLESSGRAPREVARVMPLLGPGDVVAIEPRQVLRVTPAPGTRDAEPEFFPSIEFDAPDLPWVYSPVVPAGARVLPWLTLVVVEATPDVVVSPGQQGQSPWVMRMPESVARRELPDLADAWAWVHAQVACAAAGEIAQTLAQHPDRTMSRLLAPRRLLPFRAYRAAVVPAYRAGRVAGLGGDPAADAGIVTGREPAWSAADMPAELPVYYTWTFRTGEAGDFESLAQRLRAAPLDATIAPTPLHLSLPTGDGTMTVDWASPLRVPGSPPPRQPRPAAALAELRRALKPGTASKPVLGPAYIGAPWVEGAPLAPLTAWAPELNLTPMLRAAAGLGADAVRAEQDALVAAASEQFDAFRAARREGRQRQFAAVFVNRVNGRLAAAPARERARVFAPLVASAQGAASNAGAYTAAGRRIARKAWAAPPVTAPGPGTGPAEGPAPVLTPAVAYRPVIDRTPAADPDPAPPVNPTAIPAGAFAPRFSRPMSEPLAERHPELMLPGAGAIDQDSALLVESNPAFVEAFLAGANQELSYELLWRGLPADPRATPFRKFWGHTGATEDIGDIAGWAADTPVGSHITTSASMILLVRSELVRRYPSVALAVVPGEWQRDGSRAPSRDPARLVVPGFRGRIGDDVLYAGFAQPSLPEAIGAATPDGPAGWFFLLSENPGAPRFGLDPDGGGRPPTRATLSWTHLALPDGARHATAASLPAVPDAGFTPAAATAASIASLVRQRPFQAFLHASLLVRLPG
jgi:hypothetical protein